MTAEPRATLTCQDLISMLMGYLEATVDADTAELFERHLAVCPACVAYVNTYKRTRELTGRAERVEIPEDMKQRLRELLLQQLGRGSTG